VTSAVFDYAFCGKHLNLGLTGVEEKDIFLDQRVNCHSRGVSVNDATRKVSRLAIPRLGLFLSALQHSFPGISHNVSYCLSVQITNSKYELTLRFRC